MSGAPTIRGSSQLTNPPIIIGILMKENYNECMGSDDYVVNFIIFD